MRKRTKLRKKVHTNPSISSKIMSIEQSICESHSKEKLYDETLAVTRIKSDPNFFFRCAKKFSICTKAMGPLLHPVTHLLTNNKTEMCTILLDQFSSVFSTPKPDMIISDPVSFFSCQSIPIGAELNYLSDIEFSESIIVESIKELSSNSAAGPDGFPSSLLINCSDILAPALKVMFSQSLAQGVFPSALKRAGGGLITLIRDNITFTTTDIPSTINTHNIEPQMVKVHINNTKHITIANIYIPPRDTTSTHYKTADTDIQHCIQYITNIPHSVLSGTRTLMTTEDN